MGTTTALAVKLGIAVLGLFRAMGAWLLGRKNRKIGKLEERLRGYEATQTANERGSKARRDQRMRDAGGVPDANDPFRRD